MNAGTGLFLVADFVELLKVKGLLLPDGSFDSSRLDTIQEDLEFAVSVEALLKAYGLVVPEKIDQIIAFLPIIASFIR